MSARLPQRFVPRGHASLGFETCALARRASFGVSFGLGLASRQVERLKEGFGRSRTRPERSETRLRSDFPTSCVGVGEKKRVPIRACPGKWKGGFHLRYWWLTFDETIPTVTTCVRRQAPGSQVLRPQRGICSRSCCVHPAGREGRFKVVGGRNPFVNDGLAHVKWLVDINARVNQCRRVSS